jgi:hypothetical protein
MMMRARHPLRAPLRLLPLAFVGLACRDAISAHAPEPVAARDAASQVATSVQFRFETPARDDRFDHARLRIARYALAPSKLEDDTLLWTARQGARRELLALGQPTAQGYRLRAARSVPLPARVGESRHYVALDTLPDGDRLWITQVDHAIGTVTPDAVAGVFTAWLRSAEREAPAVRADYRATASRTADAFGRLLTLDSVRTTRLADGSTHVRLGLQLHPERIAAEFPDFARYLRKYVAPASYRITLRDRAVVGAHANDTWFVAEAKENLLQFTFRTRDGALQPLDGPLRARPDTLAIHLDVAAKVGLFTVGANAVRGDLVFVRAPQEVGWAMRFAHPPEWDLPPIAGRMVRTPLNRPFQGDGATLRLTVRRQANGQTAIHRRSTFAVHESTIMRWIGNLGFTAVDDFAGRVEREEARFLAEAMVALRRDLGALPLTSSP